MKKLIAMILAAAMLLSPEGLKFDKNKNSEAVHFQEQYYENEIEIYN